MNALISIIIPSYGSPFYLGKAIKSVQEQAFKEWELIVVDDNNPDTAARKETEEVMRNVSENDDRIIYIQHPRNLNGAAARNTGLSKACGKYIAFLDSDDEYCPGRLQICYNVMEKAPAYVAGIYSGCEFRRKGKKYHVERTIPSGNFLVQTLACTFKFCTGSNIFVRKSVVDELNGFDATFLRHQDYEFLVRLFKKYSLIGISEVLVIKNNDDVNLPNVEKLIVIKKQYLNKFDDIIKGLSQKDKNYVFQSNYIGVAEVAMGQKSYDVANVYYQSAKQYGPLPVRVWLRRLAFTILKYLN